MLAASAVLISGPASVSNFQEEPLEITTFNSLSWPPGILPPPSATEKKKKKKNGGWRKERGGEWKRRRENKMVLVWFKVCLSLFPWLYATSAEVKYRWWFWPRSCELWQQGCWLRSAPGWLEFPSEWLQAALLGSLPRSRTGETGRFTALCKSNCSWHSWHRGTSGHLKHKSYRKGNEAFPRSGSVTQLPPDDLFYLFFYPDLWIATHKRQCGEWGKARAVSQSISPSLDMCAAWWSPPERALDSHNKKLLKVF